MSVQQLSFPSRWSSGVLRAQYAARPADATRMLANVSFGGAAASFDAPNLVVPITQLASTIAHESWLGEGKLVRGRVGQIEFTRADDVLFGAVVCSEEPSLEDAARNAYREILSFVRMAGPQRLLRMWNHFPRINEEHRGLERYREFCIGRHDAFREAGYRFDGDVPAASAVGSAGEGLVVYFLTTRGHVEYIENPRQVSAYHYPRIYGPKSPSFARASVRASNAGLEIYVSGTASVVGHETKHAGNLELQVEETVRNLKQVLASATRGVAAEYPGDGRSLFKVYLRHGSDLDAAKRILARDLGDGHEMLFLEADICRRELLVEIEAITRIDL